MAIREGTCSRCGSATLSGVRGPVATCCVACRITEGRERAIRNARAQGIQPRRTRKPLRPERTTLQMVKPARSCRFCGTALGTDRWAFCSQPCLKAHGRRAYPEDPQRVAARSSQRRARLKGAAAPAMVIPAVVFERDAWTCQLCDRPITPGLPHNDPGEATIDHRIPLARGGDHSYANTQAAHRRCNTAKGAT